MHRTLSSRMQTWSWLQPALWLLGSEMRARPAYAPTVSSSRCTSACSLQPPECTLLYHLLLCRTWCNTVSAAAFSNGSVLVAVQH